jgi:aspartate aminotransferase-like enzyme
MSSPAASLFFLRSFRIFPTFHNHKVNLVQIKSFSSGVSSISGKKLFTPGPLCVSETVRLALLRDLGSRDEEFISIVRSLRSKLLQVGKFPPDQYTTVLVQGSGTFGVEAVLQSCEKERRKVLILASGAYGRRMGEICSKVGVPFLLIHFPENERVDLGRVEHALDTAGPEGFSAVAVVHCETTSGVLNDIAGLGRLVRKKAPSAWYIVDAMSSFGGVDCEYENVDFLVSSANKCLQGVPGFSFVIADKQKLLESKGIFHLSGVNPFVR